MKVTPEIEKQILKLIEQGFFQKEIAKKLHLSETMISYILRPELREKNRNYKKLWRKQNPDYQNQYNEEHKEIIAKQSKEYKRKHKKEILIYQNKYNKERKEKDPIYRLICNQRSRINDVLNGNFKIGKTIDLLGCTPQFLKEYLESKFLPAYDNYPDMSWENYGRRGWHIDHIKACTKFDLSKLEEQEKCFHYTNLQPLWAKENIGKGNR
jgi:predicted transcriptional regulator